MKNLFNFEGRIDRLSYFYVGLFALIMGDVLWFIKDYLFLFIIFFIIWLGFIGMYVCAAVKRFHDLNRPGAEAWTLLIPIYAIYPNLILLFKKGTAGANIYGDNPLGNENARVEKESYISENKAEHKPEKIIKEEKWWEGWS